jgi:hypothetical protein
MISNRTYGIDSDVISYNARIVAGGNQSLSMQSLRQLNQFVISIKKMNLWANIIFWPLKANQNAGTGITAYSLGGLGPYDGVISNNPIWGINGLTINANSQNIAFGSLDFGSSTFLYVANPSWGTLSAYNDVIIQFASYSATGGINIKQRDYMIAGGNMSGNPICKDAAVELIDYSDGSFNYGGQANYDSMLTQNSFRFCSMQANGTTYKFYLSGSLLSTVIGNKNFDIPANGSDYSGGRKTDLFVRFLNFALGSNIQIPFLCLIKSQLTDADHAKFYSIYKKTLGEGLALP